MKTTIIITLLCVLSPALVVGQSISLECADLPGVWTAPSAELPLSVSNFQVRIQGPKASWVQLLPTVTVSAGTQMPTDFFVKVLNSRPLSNVMASDPVRFELNPNDLNPPAWVINSELTKLFYKFSVSNLGNLNAYSPVAIKDWCVPLLSGTTPRIWDAAPDIWTIGTPGHGYGGANSGWWSSCLSESHSTNKDWSAATLLRHAIILQSAVNEMGDAAANSFFDSDQYRDLLLEDKLQLQLQAIALIDPTINPPTTDYGSDLDVPGLPVLPSGPGNPLTSNSNPITLTPIMSSPVGGVIVDGGNLPGEALFFDLPSGVQPIVLSWARAGGGSVSAVAVSASHRGCPARYRVVVPQGVALGPITMTTAFLPVPFVVGLQTEVPAP